MKRLWQIIIEARQIKRDPIPRNRVPKHATIHNARPIHDPTGVNAVIADKDQDVHISWGAPLRARAGKDYIVSKSPEDRWVVRKDIFDTTYKKHRDGKFRKRKDVVYKYYIAGRARTVKTLEGPVKTERGDHVMIGTVGEHWPVKPDKFLKKYKKV